MKNIFLILFLVSIHSYAIDTSVIDKYIYYPQDKITDNFCVNIYSPEMMKLLKDKLVYSRDEKLIGKLCKNSNKTSVEFIYSNIDKLNNLERLKEVYINKLEYIIPTKFSEILKNFEVTKKGNVYTGESVSDSSLNKIIIVMSGKYKIPKKITYKRATGITTMTLKWNRFKWSNNKFVPISMNISKIEGLQNTEMNIKLTYENLVKIGLINKLEISSIQNITSKKTFKGISKNSNIVFHFQNYTL